MNGFSIISGFVNQLCLLLEQSTGQTGGGAFLWGLVGLVLWWRLFYLCIPTLLPLKKQDEGLKPVPGIRPVSLAKGTRPMEL
jgi:hypothetical protein